MRIANGVLPILGPGIPAGKLDILVALDPWEALRHLRLAHAGTVCFVETEVMPFFTGRSEVGEREVANSSPVDSINQLPLQINWRNYRKDAVELYGTANMANYLAGLDCLTAMNLDLTDDYKKIFITTIPKSKGVMHL